MPSVCLLIARKQWILLTEDVLNGQEYLLLRGIQRAGLFLLLDFGLRTSGFVSFERAIRKALQHL